MCGIAVNEDNRAVATLRTLLLAISSFNRIVAMSCSICLTSLPKSFNKFYSTIGSPSISYGELLLECTGIEYDTNNGLCEDCCQYLERFHDAIQIVEKIKKHFGDLIEYHKLDSSELKCIKAGVTFEAIDVNNQDTVVEPKVEIEEHEADEVEIENVLVREIIIDDGMLNIDGADLRVSDMSFYADPFDDTNAKRRAKYSGNDKLLQNVWGNQEKIGLQSIHIERLATQSVDETDTDTAARLQFQDDCDGDDDNDHDDADRSQSPQLSTEDESNDDGGDSDYMPNDFKMGKSRKDTKNNSNDGTNESETQQEEEDKRKKRSYMKLTMPEDGKCPECGKSVPNKYAYRIHLKIHTDTQGFICEVCGKTLKTRTGFNNHQQNHSGVQYTCDVCGKTYTNQIKLKHHMAWHTGLEPYQCNVCGKRFVHNKNLYTHKQSHLPEKKVIPCPQCDRKFRTNEHLKRHIAAHSGLKTHQCPVCFKFFTQVYNMRVHLNEHNHPGSAKQHRLRCKKCKRSFRNKDNYAEHCKANDCKRIE